MEVNLLFFIIVISLIGLLIYKEKNYQKVIRELLIAKLSKDTEEFKFALKEEKEEEKPVKQIEEIPLEEVSAEELLKVFNKK